MKGLIKKDIITASKSIIIFNGLYIIGLIAILLLGGNDHAKAFFGGMGAILIPLMTAKFTSNDQMQKLYDVVMNSFPVKRKDIVISGYIFTIIIFLIPNVIFFIFSMLTSFEGSGDIIGMLFLISLVFVYYALITGVTNTTAYIMDNDKATKYTTIALLGAIYIPILIVVVITKAFPTLVDSIEKFFTQNPNSLFWTTLAAFLVAILIYVISAILSTNGYAKKDLN